MSGSHLRYSAKSAHLLFRGSIVASCVGSKMIEAIGMDEGPLLSNI
jgi:hypothetical protein